MQLLEALVVRPVNARLAISVEQVKELEALTVPVHA